MPRVPTTPARAAASPSARRPASPSRAAQAVTLSRAECLELLATNHLGRVVVTVGADHRPLIRPVNYLFDETAQAVTFRCAPGTKLHALLRSASACFEIDDHDAEARTGWSVVVYGVSEPVVRPTAILRLERSGLDSLAPGPQPEWIRIRATTVTGMRIHAAPAASTLSDFRPECAAREPRKTRENPGPL
jgi:nitroimidazol reductase NimA-like FMN-containing flavoprotein (pyridoxamine 5'-phosphate oxidase superfamily)